MLITIAGHKTDFEVRTLPRAAEHFIHKLIPSEEVRKDLDIYIEIVDGFKDCPDGSVYGFSSPDFGDDEEHDDPKHFYIALYRTDEDDMMETLAHECVHVRQHAMNELQKRKDKIYWFGKEYEDLGLYEEYPWEQEAYIFEKVLIENWKKEILCIM